MRAAVYYGPGDIRIEQRPKPVAGANQAVVKIDYVGICGTDVHSYHRDGLVAPARILGHENVGTVVEIGPGVTSLEPGDQILCGPPSHCKEGCPICRTGATNICINGFPRTAGIGQVDGGYAEYMLVPDVAHTMLIKVPPGVDPREAVLFDVVCVSFHAIRKSRFRLGDNVVVSGAGPIGLSAISLLKLGGAGKIIALEPDESKYPLIKSYGADHILNPIQEKDLRGKIIEIVGSGVGADVVFECVGSAKSLEACVLASVKPGGQVMMVGTSGEPIGLSSGALVICEIDLQASFVYTPDEVSTYLELMAAGKINFKSLVTDVIRLEDCVNKGLARLLKPNNGQIKILIDPSLL